MSKNFVLDGSKIDWRLLTQQKSSLCQLQRQTVRAGHPRHEGLEGILSFLDYIQDEAAKQLGEFLVYGEADEEDEAND